MEFDANTPIYLQVIKDVKQEIINGKLKLGEKLPSAREIAVRYRINPNTANRIYREMETEGLCFTKRGVGTFVTEDMEKVKQIREEMSEKLLNDFMKGMKDLGYEPEDVIKGLSANLKSEKKRRDESDD